MLRPLGGLGTGKTPWVSGGFTGSVGKSGRVRGSRPPGHQQLDQSDYYYQLLAGLHQTEVSWETFFHVCCRYVCIPRYS